MNKKILAFITALFLLLSFNFLCVNAEDEELDDDAFFSTLTDLEERNNVYQGISELVTYYYDYINDNATSFDINVTPVYFRVLLRPDNQYYYYSYCLEEFNYTLDNETHNGYIILDVNYNLIEISFESFSPYRSYETDIPDNYCTSDGYSNFDFVFDDNAVGNNKYRKVTLTDTTINLGQSQENTISRNVRKKAIPLGSSEITNIFSTLDSLDKVAIPNSFYFQQLYSDTSEYGQGDGVITNYENGIQYGTDEMEGFTFSGCGYTAMGMLLGYYNYFYDDTIISNDMVIPRKGSESTNGPLIKHTINSYDLRTQRSPGVSDEFGAYLFHTYQYNSFPVTIAGSDLTTNSSLRKNLNQFLNDNDKFEVEAAEKYAFLIKHGYVANLVSDYFAEAIMSYIDQGIPVMLTINGYKYYSSNIAIQKQFYIGHVVVCYGYVEYNNKIYFITNYGHRHKNYSTVYIDSDSVYGYNAIIFDGERNLTNADSNFGYNISLNCGDVLKVNPNDFDVSQSNYIYGLHENTIIEHDVNNNNHYLTFRCGICGYLITSSIFDGEFTRLNSSTHRLCFGVDDYIEESHVCSSTYYSAAKHKNECTYCDYIGYENHSYTYTTHNSTSCKAVCSDCQYTSYPSHNFNISNGKRTCINCKYSESIPSHTHVYEYYYYSTAKHSCRCTICAYQKQEFHVLNADGICGKCGYDSTSNIFTAPHDNNEELFLIIKKEENE